MHPHPINPVIVDTSIDKTQLNASLASTLDPNMIKYASPLHPRGLTEVQHRLLYESDTESSYDFPFSTSSSTGSTSAYSDLGSQSSSRSRTSSQGLARRAHGSSASSSRSESISSVLSSSAAIQRVLMGTPSTATVHVPSSRQSVRAIARAFEQAGKTSTTLPSRKMSAQLERVIETSATINLMSDTTSSDVSHHTAFRRRPLHPSQASNLAAGRSAEANGTMPSRLTIAKSAAQGPLSAPATTTARTSRSNAYRCDTSEAVHSASAFKFPPRVAHVESQQRVRSSPSLETFDDDDEPAFEIIPSPSRKRSQPILPPFVASPTIEFPPSPPATLTQITSSIDSDLVPSSLSAGSLDSMHSNYSYGSVRSHPFALQLSSGDERYPRASSAASMQGVHELDRFRGPSIDRAADNPSASSLAGNEGLCRRCAAPTSLNMGGGTSLHASTATLQPASLSTSRPSSSASSSTTTVVPSGKVASQPGSTQVTDKIAFPLPPSAARTNEMLTLPHRLPYRTSKAGRPSSPPLTTAAKPTTLDELRREAHSLLASISALSAELDASIPPTHRLPGSTHRAASPPTTPTTNTKRQGKPPFVAVDESFADVWRCMDEWYWSSFEIAPPSTG
ncbi:hypothetical protein PSEUBRA_000744 [Kalmanozyma brasiliensis GHG001]|uniref:uncharacterized protein n=1 Tax=Kalmanozyma brasiliensis (strain GHG001) TaxID=1365824 RepID=UPI0028683AE7|nr:uncharacterized protein PSEUBRA_000744 [Kalmanozyma brasiliensis GHG001]EST09529.2 hypothetical protein PSEUBRA_000744 [Kalmanozyma brasiliensis GHG001]